MRACASVLLLALFAPASAAAQDSERPVAESRVDALRARAHRIEEGRGAESAADALAHARRALRAASRGEDSRARRRALSIADAALILADRLAARARARSALEETRERKRVAARRARAAREALERAIAERERPPEGEK